jgi:hypothetical protein
MSIPIAASGPRKVASAIFIARTIWSRPVTGFIVVPGKSIGSKWDRGKIVVCSTVFCMRKTSMKFPPKTAVVNPWQTANLRTKDRHPLPSALELRLFEVCAWPSGRVPCRSHLIHRQNGQKCHDAELTC